MKRVIVGITGASGSIYGKRIVEVLVANSYLVDIIFSEIGKKVFEYEIGMTVEEFVDSFPREQVTLFSHNDLFALPSSGSYQAIGMIIAPCSAGTLGHIASGTTRNLIHRAADVTLKEKRSLILVLRETPLNRIHIENMLKVNDAGATILPASPGFYGKPQKVDDLVNFVVERALRALTGKEFNLIKNWGE
ncbi:3-octaprenyl-4-hydroxybenzoate carboxy-lyase [Desulfurobacterium thermolithotrophum DSM 11699]|uniref:Flavin prenyltransferase UbiX n=1 Tax=Desulfurobacterium thermolithotrophum (strain DSM 11699 / BSA) TaxID=868864 RepID=F0S230_DESTD|nr:UbiX family flavin prenyltransferase [Desulfurobacterium thermolithotrophum]ADY72973.1 3-octaprenyl-4-hydroxybenzoate carboxy-lyase [Desulfurobacterium thermolithotrophum DSM 11699]